MRLMKVSYVFGLIGAMIMIISEVILLGINGLLFFLLSFGGLGLGEFGLELMPVTIVISLILGIFALNYVLKSRQGSKKKFLIILIIGIIAAVGVFIPILPARILDIGGGETYPAPAVSLVNSLLYLEPYFLINYGLLGWLSFVESEQDSAYAELEADDYSVVSEKDL